MKPPVIELDQKRIEEFLQRAEEALKPDDFAFVTTLIQALVFLNNLVQKKSRSIVDLLRMLFGIKTESSKRILKNPSDSSPSDDSNRPPPKGHGRNGVKDYPGATKIPVPHEKLKSGDQCPECEEGKVYPIEPGVVMRFLAAAPIQLVIYLLEKLRCNLCGEIFTAQKPPEAGEQKYDETVASMVAVLRYGNGFPFNRLEKLQDSCGIPLPASTQWDIVDEKAEELIPVYTELVREAAQADLIYQDDTKMRVLSFGKEMKEENKKENKKEPSRKGIFTTGLVCESEEKTIACFFTGRRHAGENLRDLLKQRLSELSPPIQMCDALSWNMPDDLLTILANCLGHGRRNFVKLIDAFPDECRYVIEILAKVYHNDALSKEQSLLPDERLKLHQEKSAPLMKELKEWMETQLRDKLVEPNSGLGKAISYMLSRWEKFTLFLNIPGAPLDNNICERALKMAIRHRKNSLFYKTERGAWVGDLFMSLIHTCNLMGVNAFEYLTALMRNIARIAEEPSRWMPWNYKQTLSEIPP
jgi:transposase